MQTTQSQPQAALHPIIQNLFSKRGLNHNEQEEFLSWDLKSLPKLTDLHDITKAAERIKKSMSYGKKIGVYGDYDVDGTTSCALFWQFFKSLDYENVVLIQPSRFVEGYGLHKSSIDDAVSQDIDLLITVDCGITNTEAALYSKEKGLDLIITDHHTDACEKMPEAYAIVNPNRRDEPENSPLKTLAGVGVAFCVCLEVKNLLESEGKACPSLYPLLEYVAIGTICDLAKLTPVNLKLVRHGLKKVKDSSFLGVKAFFTPEERSRPIIPSEKLSFQVGPLINSKGRLDHPEKALKLLISNNSEEAFTYYAHLNDCNTERKKITSLVFDEAKDQVITDCKDEDLIINIVYKGDWHEGVIGIVASRLVETFKVPAIVFSDAEEEGVIKASARSAGPLNLFDCLNQNSDLFIKFGGHKAAAGLSMKKENLPLLKENLKNLLKDFPLIERTVPEDYDLEISAHEINSELLSHLDLLEPFGMGNEKPLFKVKGLTLQSFDLLKEVHVRWNFVTGQSGPNGSPLRFKGISFNYAGKWGVLSPDRIYDLQFSNDSDLSVYCHLSLNRFNGRESIQLMVEKITL